ncbi:hypothetical protein [Streptomyces sp. NPDC001380]|uniref:hypothetical protein n=1 Tax=Streptomyces sp. NPDC001380 TaxID=3364566 RepID=UPI00369B9C6F
MWFSCLVFALMVPICLWLPWGGDLGVHAATLERLRASLTHPGNPMVAEQTPSPYYSPWTVSLTLIGRLTGLGTFHLLSVGGLISLPVMVSGVFRLTRALTPARWAPVLAFLCVMLLWGPQVWSWSGFLSLTSWALSLSYPSTIGWGLTLHLWAFLPLVARRGWRWPDCLGLGAFAALVLLVHQFTGAIAVIGAVAFAAASWRSLDRRACLRVGSGIALTAVILALWPYYRFFSLGNSPEMDGIHKPLYQMLLAHFGFALVGLPALYARARRRLLDPLLLLFAGCTAVYLAGAVSGHWAFGRILPGALIALQFAAAVEVAERGGGLLVRRVLTPLVACGLLAGLWVQCGTVSYTVTGSSSLTRDTPVPHLDILSGYTWTTPYVRRGDVVMTDSYHAQRRLPAYGGYVVFCLFPDPFLKDWSVRRDDTVRFFSASASRAQREAILRKYHVSWVIAAQGDSPRRTPGLTHPVAVGPHGERLYRVSGYAR